MFPPIFGTCFMCRRTASFGRRSKRIKVVLGDRPSNKCVLCPCLSNGRSYAFVAYWEGTKMVSQKRVLFIKSFDFVTKRVF